MKLIDTLKSRWPRRQEAAASAMSGPVVGSGGFAPHPRVVM